MTEPSSIPIIRQELPSQCDGCGADYKFLEAIAQTSSAWYGKKDLIVGYSCNECGGTFLYR